MDNDTILNRIFDKLDKFDGKVDDLCERMTKIETTITDHLNMLKSNEERKDRNFKIGFGVVGVVFGFYAILKELL